MKFDLKKLLKNYKLNEEKISMILGAVVVIIVGLSIVNYFKDKKSQVTPEALTAINQTQTGKTHKVIKGETLWSIAENVYGSGYNWTDIYNSNNLKSEQIEVGQELSLPDVSVKEPTTTKIVSTTSQADNQNISGESYTVVHGDTLWNISVRTYGDGYQWTKIAQANNLKNPGLIHAGNVLTLPR